MHKEYVEFIETFRHTWSERTLIDYERLLRRLPSPEEIDKKYLLHWFRPLAKSTQAKYMGNLNKLGTFLGMDLLFDIPWPKVSIFDTPIERKHLINSERFEKLLQSCRHHRDQMWLELAIESGGRRKELQTLDCEDIAFDTDGLAFVTLSGKTGTREVPIYECVPRVIRHLEEHPTGRGAFWRCINKPSKRISYKTAYLIMRGMYERSGLLIPPSCCHITRHTRATELATMLTEAEMRRFFGWTPNSNMPLKYIHLANQDLTMSFKRKVLGIEPDTPPQILTAKLCPNCQTRNVSTARVCKNCQLVLSKDLAVEKARERRMGDALATMLATGDISRDELQKIVREEVRKALSLPSSSAEESEI